MLGDKVKPNDRDNFLIRKLDASLREVLSIQQQISTKPFDKTEIAIDYGVSIRISGDMNGVLLLQAEAEVFQGISEQVFGWKLSDWMFSSFARELVNMITGCFSMELSLEGISTYLLEPKLIERKTVDFSQAVGIHVISELEETGVLDVYLLIDEMEDI